MLCLPQSLALLLLGDLPQANPGNTGNVPGPGGVAPQAGVGGNAATGSGVAAQGSPPSPVPAPPGIIQPQEYYTLGPNDGDQRFTGVQMREAVVRAGQYDNLQGEFHRQERELSQERQGRETAERQVQEYQEQERLSNYMQQYGLGQQPNSPTSQPQNQSQQPQQPQPGQQPGVPLVGEVGEDWLANYGVPAAGQPDGSAGLPGQGANVQPGSPGAAPQPSSAPSAMDDPRKMAIMMKAIVDDSLSKTLTPMQQQLPELVNAAVNQRFNQQSRQDNVRESFQAGRQQLSTDLNQKWGIDPNRSRDILDNGL